MKTSELMLDTRQRILRDARGRVFDLATHEWRAEETTLTGKRIGASDALRWLQRDSGHPRREPIGVIGARHASAEEHSQAYALGAVLAKLGCVVLCGGRGGVMRAVCEGVASAGGVSVGLLPGDTIADGNDAVTIPIATGIGLARNALIARAALCLVAVGGRYGTISEMAYGLQFGKAVFALHGAPAIEGVETVASVDAAVEAVAHVALGLDRRARAAAQAAGA
ncbi:pyrimidine/purine-5'-nucleotide nucleosidase [Burkholderiales bacterium]|nr:pyrimidine/purine-5'-nucleotide nucleosidase [Burkholderiales bacterium]